jgi:hypothetical protein
MNSKKAITLLVLTTLIMSIFPIIPVKAITAGGLSSVSVVYDETITVDGTGVTAGANVEVYWDAVAPWDGEAGLLNSTKAKASGAWDCEIDIPEALVGEHYVWARDISTGDTVVFPVVTMNPSLEFDPSSGLPNDDIDVSGYGFGDETEITDFEWFNTTAAAWEPITLSPSAPDTDELGTWSASFDVPSDFGYGTVDMRATDDDTVPNVAVEPFTTGASISLDIDEGPVGSLVKIDGRGFVGPGTIDTGAVTIGPGLVCEVLESDTIGPSPKYEFTVEIIIPSVPEQEWPITVTFGANSASEDFEVHEDGSASVKVEPTFGVQGSTVAISGYNFSQVNEGEVIVELWDGGYVTDIETYETDSNGEFSGTFQVPAQSNGLYDIYAYQPDYDIDDSADFKIGSVIVILNKVSGPSGLEVVLTGTGFEYDAEWNCTFGDETVIEDNAETDSDGNLEVNGQVPKFWVPSLPPGVYEVTVMDAEGTTVTVDFDLTETTMVETDPLVAPAGEGASGFGYNVTILGQYFSQDEDVELTFDLYNDTDEWEEIDVDWWLPGPVQVQDDDDGSFEAWWQVDTDLSVGTYWLNVTDDNDLFAQYILELVPKTVEIEPRKSTFRIGDTVAYTIEHSFGTPGSYIKIWDPTGNLYWQTDAFASGMWVKVGSVVRLPYFAQVAGGNPMTLLDDAPLGTWEWTWYDSGDDELDTGTFEVIEAEADVLGQQVADLNNQITDLSDQISDVTDEFDDVKSDIADVAAIAEQAVAAANAATDAVQTVAQTANQANTAAENAATAAEAARDAANSLTTLVYGAIGAALVAALAAIVSLMQISRRIAG